MSIPNPQNVVTGVSDNDLLKLYADTSDVRRKRLAAELTALHRRIVEAIDPPVGSVANVEHDQAIEVDHRYMIADILMKLEEAQADIETTLATIGYPVPMPEVPF